MIDTDAIRNKVLELALQGKLTVQLALDGTAEDLYNRIQEEKKILMKEGKIKKTKLPPIAYKDIPFDIPDSWKWVRWGDLSESIQYGYNAPAKETGRIKMVRISDIQDNEVMWESVPYCDIEEENIQTYLLHKNDILFARTGGTVGKSYIVSEIPEEAIYAGYLIRTSYSTRLCAKYMKYFMESRLYWKQLQNGTIATAQPNCNGQTLSKMVLPLPPVDEQYQIVNKIDKIFSVLDTIDELQSQYSFDIEVLRNKLIDAGIHGKLSEQLPDDGTAEDLYAVIQVEKAKILEQRNSREDKKIKDVEDDVPFDVPSHWKWIRLGDIGLFKKGPFGSALTKSMFVQKGTDTIKVYEQQHAIKKDCELGTYYITREYFNEKMSGFEVMSGDIIVSCAGTIGETYIMPDDIEQGIINQALMRVTLAEGIDKKFFQYYFDTNLKKTAQEESNGSAIKNIPPFDVLKNWYFPLTSIEEQRRIVSKIDEILAYM